MYPTSQEFVNLLRKAGWRQVDAARAMRLTTATVSRYCTGEVEVPPSSLDHLARIIGIRPDAPEFRAMHEGPVWLEPWQTELLGVFGRLDASARRRVTGADREIIEALIGASQYRRPTGYGQNTPPSHDDIAHIVGGDIIGAPEPTLPSAAAAAAGPAQLFQVPPAVSAAPPRKAVPRKKGTAA